MARPNLLSCYEKINLLQVKLPHLKERFGFSDITGVIHSAQMDLQEVQLLSLACSFICISCPSFRLFLLRNALPGVLDSYISQHFKN